MIPALAPGSVDAVITSPPYPNEKDYTRTTRLEMVLLGFVHNRAELQSLETWVDPLEHAERLPG